MKRTLALTLCFGLALPLLAEAKPKDKEEKEQQRASRKIEKAERKLDRREDRQVRGEFREQRRFEDASIRSRVAIRPEQPQVVAQPVVASEVNTQVRPREFRRRNVERRGPRDHAWSYDEARRYQLRERRDRDWWRSRYNRFALFGGGYYYWDRGYWYPAYGYDTRYSTYTYDEPIYGYNYMEPRQVMVRVQRELRREGYYRGPIDGLIGPMTRAALARFQRDAGLYVTRRIDGPTLAALGVV